MATTTNTKAVGDFIPSLSQMTSIPQSVMKNTPNTKAVGDSVLSSPNITPQSVMKTTPNTKAVSDFIPTLCGTTSLPQSVMATTTKTKEAVEIPPSHLDNLPPELKVEILKNLPDKSSLKALVQSSPLFYHVYRSQRHNVLISISKLPNMSPEILGCVLATSDKFFFQPFPDFPSPKVLLMFSGHPFSIPTTLYPESESTESHSISSRHIAIEKTTKTFLNYTLSVSPLNVTKASIYASTFGLG